MSDYNFKHFLQFTFGKVEVFEPIGFDASNFVIEQDKGKFGRDIVFGNDEIDLEFGNEIGSPLALSRTLNNGVILTHKNSGLDLLLYENKTVGSEADVKYILQKDNVDFTIGELDFGGATTDGFTYFKCKVVQNSELALVKRREDVKVDLFSDRDLDGNTITPMPTHKFLLKAKPIDKESKWINTLPEIITQGGVNEPFFINTINGLEKSEIDDSLTWLDYSAVGGSASNEVRDIGKSLYNPDNTITNVKVTIDIDVRSVYYPNTNNEPIQMRGKCFISPNEPNQWLAGINDTSSTFLNYVVPVNGVQTLNDTFEFNFDIIPTGYYLYVVFYFISSGNGFLYNYFNNSNVTIKATSTAISSTIDASRYIDLIKQNYKSINAKPVIAPKFDVGGQFYDQFCFNGKMIRQIKSPYYISLDKTIESTLEVAGGSQVNKDNNFIGQYTDFYPNYDLGGYLQNPDKEMNIIKNDKYLINKFNYKYEKFEKDRDEDSTLDAINTESEWYVPNIRSQNEKKINNPFIRDAYKIETVRRRATANNLTSEESDDDTFILDAVEISPNSRGKFSAVLNVLSNPTAQTIKILATDRFRWTLLGFNVGDTVNVNNVNYLVLAMTPSVITLQWFGGFFSGPLIVRFDYPLTNVAWTNRTNEGLIYSENLLNADNFSNLRYSIKRNMEHWKPYLATAGKFIPTKSIDNSYFKSNGECITRFTGEVANIKENESFSISSISDKKILTQNLIKTTVTADFKQVKELVDNMQRINADNTIGGFIRIQDNEKRTLKGYVQKLDYLWKYNELTLVLEEKNESDFLEVTFANNLLTINDVGYPTRTSVQKIFHIYNDFIRFLDVNNVYLCNSTKFNLVRFNGVVYNSSIELATAIQNAV